MFTLQNKWKQGRANLNFADLDRRLLTVHCALFPVPATLSAHVGLEITLLYIDHSPFLQQLARHVPLNMNLKSGIIRTAFGPVLFHLFSFHSTGESEPLLLMDVYVNPCDPKSLRPWHRLAHQSHWHLFLIDGQGVQAGFSEYANTFGLEETLAMVQQGCSGMVQTDFMAAKEEVFDRYSLDDLAAMR